MKNIILLGATGSIGQQTLEVVRANRNHFKIIAISSGRNIALTKNIIHEFDVEMVSVLKKEDCLLLQKEFPHVKFTYGNQGLIDVATYGDKTAVIINAVVGMVGLEPTIAGIKKGRDILLANKETLVVGGEIIKKLVREKNVKLLPIDSEHSAIWQCLNDHPISEVKRLIITASGGSFRELTREELKHVTVAEALNHPNWSMGSKITIDSATMVNKGLEVIEAHYLFDIDYENIETVIHPESIIHSMVEFIDKSILAQLGAPDMKVPIQYALTYPERFPYGLSESLDFNRLSTLNFRPMDYERFPLLKLAYEVGKLGGIMPVIYNTSNEVAVDLFLRNKISFLDIEDIIFESVKNTQNMLNPTLEDILNVDKELRVKLYSKFEV